MMNDIKEVFDHWNSLCIVKHRDVGMFKATINARLKLYSVSELKESMNNYAEIILSPDYYFTYKWTLRTFLLRGLDSFMTENDPHERYRDRNSQPSFNHGTMNEKQIIWNKASGTERLELEKQWREELRRREHAK